jgi:hypothetical protein
MGSREVTQRVSGHAQSSAVLSTSELRAPCDTWGCSGRDALDLANAALYSAKASEQARDALHGRACSRGAP